MIDIHDVLRTKILRFLFRLSGVKVVVIHKNRGERKRLIRRKNKLFKQLSFVQDKYADTFKKGGFIVKNTPYHIYTKNDELPDDLLKITGEKDKKWIGIAPFAKHQPKIYPLDKMEKIVGYFSTRNDVKIFLFGGGKYETEILNNWEKYPNIQSLAGKTSLEGELQIMAHLDAMLSMDSANMHLANLTDVPVVSVWCATHPFAGFVSCGNPKNTIIQRDLSCRPCSIYGNKVCYKNTYECMDIAIEEIINRLLLT